MAATRFTHLDVPPRRGVYAEFCTTCRRVTIKRGRQGARNRSNACSMACHERYQTMHRGSNLARAVATEAPQLFEFFPVENA